MTRDMESIIEETQKILQIKKASLNKSASFATAVVQNPPESIGTMKEVSEDAKKMTPKARKEEEDRNISESGNTAAGAGDDSKVTRGHALTAEQQAAVPKEEPAITDDAKAEPKKASASLANDLLSAIRNYQQASVKTAGDVEKAEKKDEPKVEAKPEVKPAVKPEAKKEEAKPEIKAAGDKIELDNEILRKIGSYVLATEEGVSLVRNTLEKEAGAEAAESLMNYFNEKKAADEQAKGAEAAQNLINQAIYESGVKAGLAKTAELFKKASEGTLTDEDMKLVKLAQALADQSAVDLSGAMGGEAAPGAAIAPEAAGPAAMPEGNDEEISVEDLAAALEQLVQSGVIQPDEVQKILDYLASGAGAEGDAGGAEVSGAPEAPEAPAEEAPSEQKEAAVKQAKVTKLATTLAAHIGAAKAIAAKK